jgi:hypothetical protein
MLISAATIGSRVIIGLDEWNSVTDSLKEAKSLIAVTVLRNGTVGIRHGEKGWSRYRNVPGPDELLTDPLIESVRSAAKAECIPALNRRFLK